jgi:Flp pilus assembly protein TadG
MLIRLLKERRSVAALEFVLVAPILVALLFGVYDLSNALIVYEEVYSAAHSMAASITNEAVQANGTNSLTYSQVQQAESILWAEIPSLRWGLQDNALKSVTISSIVFEQASSACDPFSTQCNYVPVVVWSIAYMGGDSGRTFNTPTNETGTDASGNLNWQVVGLPLRSCIGTATAGPVSSVIGSLNQTQGNAGSSSDMTNLRTYALTTPAPTNPAPPSPMLVVDVQLNYQPVIGLVIGKTLPLWVSAYWPVRSVEVSTSTTYSLNEEFASITPDVPASVANPVELSGYNASGNKVFALYDSGGTAVATGLVLNQHTGQVTGSPTSSYCVNTSLFSAFGSSPETQ